MKTKFALIILSVLLMSSYSWAEKVSNQEMKTFLEAIKEKKDEELLIASEQFEECAEKFTEFREDTSRKKDFEDCVKEKIVGDESTEGSDEKVLEIAKNLDLQSFNKEASSTTSSIRKYLEKRLHKAIYGTDDNDKVRQKLKDQNIVDHAVFYQLYAEQIGKNTLLQVSKYCLENFGYEDPGNFVFVSGGAEGVTSDGKKKNITEISYKSVLKENLPADGTQDNKNTKYEERYELKEVLLNQSKDFLTVGTQALGVITETTLYSPVWREHKKIREYEICSFKTQKECDKHFLGETSQEVRPYRPVHIAKLLKDAEFEIAKTDPDKTNMKSRYGFCAGEVIKNMCELYKCNNVYNLGTPEQERKRCVDVFGIQVSGKQGTLMKSADPTATQAKISFDDSKKKGSIACNLKQRLEEYRVVLNQVKEIQKENQGLQNYVVFGNESFKGVYNGKQKGSKADDLTSISSKELTSKVESFSGAEAEVKKLRDECYDGDELDGFKLKEDAKENKKCDVLMARLDKAKFSTIQIDTEAKTALKMKQIEKIDNAKDLKEFLEANGLQKYIGRLDEVAGDEDKIKEIKNLVAQDFKSKRMALIDGLKERFRKERLIRIGEENSEGFNKGLDQDIADQSLASIEQHKKRVETLFEYSNIVSSYLEIKDEEGNVVGSNITGRAMEIKDDKGNLETYFTNSKEETSGGGDGINYLGALDTIINFDDENEEKEEKKD